MRKIESQSQRVPLRRYFRLSLGALDEPDFLRLKPKISAKNVAHHAMRDGEAPAVTSKMKPLGPGNFVCWKERPATLNYRLGLHEADPPDMDLSGSQAEVLRWHRPHYWSVSNRHQGPQAFYKNPNTSKKRLTPVQ